MSKKFILHFKEPYFKRNDIIETSDGHKLIITKVYKYNLWRKFLSLFGIPFKLHDAVLVKPLDK